MSLRHQFAAPDEGGSLQADIAAIIQSTTIEG
jgi:hypothetical protein